MSRLYRRSENGPWWGDWTTLDGERHQRSLRTRDKSVASRRLKAAELGKAATVAPKGPRLSEAIDYMINVSCHDKAEGTRSMYRQKGRRILTTLGDPFVTDIGRDMLSGYIDRRINPADPVHGQAARHTVKKELITIRRALKEAHLRGQIKALPPFPTFSPRYVARKVWHTEAQFTAMSAQLEPHRRRWATLAALGGLRLSEVEALDWTAITPDLRLLVPPGTKTATADKAIPIAPALRFELERTPVKERHGRVAQSWPNVTRDLDRACKRAGVPKVTANDLRRTFASWLLNQGVDLNTVAKLMRHKTTRMVEQVYGQLSQSTLERAVATLPGFGSVPTCVPTTLAAPVLDGHTLALPAPIADPASSSEPTTNTPPSRGPDAQ